VSVHPSGRYVFVANYHGGTLAVLPIRPNGTLGAATDVKQDAGQSGPVHAASAPRGSFAISGHDRPHAHMIQTDPSGRFVLSADLGLDEILVWQFDVETGKLLPLDACTAKLPAGDGPRHFTFHPNGRLLYSLQEEASTLTVFDYDAVAGRLTVRQTLSTLPHGFAGTNFTSEVLISPDGRFLYYSWDATPGNQTSTAEGERADRVLAVARGFIAECRLVVSPQAAPFAEDVVAPYLNLHLRQPLHVRRDGIGGIEALLDVRNMLAEGYRPYLLSDGSLVIFAQQQRSLRAGLAFSF